MPDVTDGRALRATPVSNDIKQYEHSHKPKNLLIINATGSLNTFVQLCHQLG